MNLDTVGLLLVTMILAAHLIVAVSGGLSAVLVNDVVCVMFTPIVLGVVRRGAASASRRSARG